MAIVLYYESITLEQKQKIWGMMEEYEGEISQLSLPPNGGTQLVLNNHEITPQRGQEVIDRLIDILQPRCWGTDLPIPLPRRNTPPQVYTSRYHFSIPYDPNVH